MDESLILGAMGGTMGGILVGMAAGHFTIPRSWRFLMKHAKRGGELAIVADTTRQRVNVMPVKQDSQNIKVKIGKVEYLYQKRAPPYHFGKAVAHFAADFHGATLDAAMAAGASAMEGLLVHAGNAGEEMDPRLVVPFPDKLPVNGGEAKIGEGVLVVPVQDAKGNIVAQVLGARAQVVGGTTFDLADLQRYSLSSVPAVELERFAKLAEAAAKHDLNKDAGWFKYLLAVMCFGVVAFVIYSMFIGGGVHMPGSAPAPPVPPLGGR